MSRGSASALNTSTSIGTNTSLLAAVLEHATRRPESLAVRAPDGDADYAGLVARALALAEALKGQGVGRGDRVVVALPPGREAIASALAAFLLAAAYVPVDPDQPPARIRQLIEGCGASAVLGPGSGGFDPADLAGTWSCAPGSVPSAPSALSALVLPRWVADPAPDDVAYVVHTSGSTGSPKAIQVEHRSILNMLAEVDRRAPASAGHVGSWWTSPGFDVAMWECWGPLTAGGSVAVLPAGRRLEADRFVAFLHEQGVAGAYVPPSFLPVLADALEGAVACCANLERLLVGVEPIPLGLVQRIVRSRPGLVVLNGYGPAETTVCCTLYPVPACGGSPSERTPIGTPIGGNRAYLVDESGKPTAAATGELVIAGVGVARGYLHSAGGGFLTADDGSGDRAYRTGDLVRIRPDGELVFLGRVDRQLKVRGHRVEPAEVEAAVRDVAPVREVAVGRRRVAGVGDALAAYVVLDSGTVLTPQEIRSRLAARLPYYAVPSVVLVLDTLPQTRHGKVDYERLASWETVPAGPTAEGEAVSPELFEDTFAAMVARAWRAELPGPLEPDRGFIESGGASLAAARLAAALRRESRREVSAADVLRSDSPGELAGILRLAPPAVEPTDRHDRGRTRARLGMHEEAMWFHDRLHEGQDVYLETLCFRLPARGIDAERLARAVRLAAADHPVFGAAIDEQADGPHLVLGAHHVELEAMPESETIGALISGAIRMPEGPLCRCLVVGRPDGTSLLVLLWHHLVVDSWSARLFLRDVQGHYDDPAYLAPRAEMTICDLILDRQRRATAPATREALAAAVAEIAPALEAVPGRPTGSADDRFGTVDVTMDEAEVDQLDRTARRSGATFAVLLISAYEHALCEVFGADAVPVAIAVDDRPFPGSEQVAGCLVDTVLHLGRRDGNATSLAAAFDPARRFPLPALVSRLRAVTGRPLFDFPTCYFGLDEEYRLSLDGLACPPVDIRRPSGRFGVTLLLRRQEGRVEGRLHHRYWALTPERADTLIDRFLSAVTELTHPHRRQE